MGFADFQEDDIQLPGFYTNIPPSRGGLATHSTLILIYNIDNLQTSYSITTPIATTTTTTVMQLINCPDRIWHPITNHTLDNLALVQFGALV